MALGISALCLLTFSAPLSPAVMAMLFGVALGSIPSWRESLGPGAAVASRMLLRLGVALLGLKFSLSALAQLGWGVLAVAVVVVAAGLGITWWLGRRLGLGRSESVLMASGFSICGAAAVAGVQSSIRGRDEDAARAIAILSVYGLILVPLLPALAYWWDLGEVSAAVWAGASLPEVGHVVGAAGLLPATVASLAVAVKLLRVLLLGPVVIGLGVAERRRGQGNEPGARRPALVPVFVLGFMACALLVSLTSLPGELLQGAELVQQIALAAGMFGLGYAVRFPLLLAAGWRLPLLGALSMVLVLALGLGGALLLAH